ncbi:MAG: polymer-forming cytoskeletal protein [Vicinamibacterales bacterium]
MRIPVITFGLLAASVAGLGPAPAAAQTRDVPRAEAAATPGLQQLRERAERRFQVIEVRRGMILIPKAERAGVRSIDLNEGQVVVDGVPLTGRELRERLGEDAELVAQLSFLDASGRRAFFAGVPAEPPVPAAVPVPPAPPSASPAGVREGWTEVARYRHGGARVRFGGDATVAEDEAIGDDVVAIFGSARVDGKVDGDVVAVAGSVHLGPRANVRGDVTAVGGSVERADGTVVSGQINEIRIAKPNFGPLATFRPWDDWRWLGDSVRTPFGGSFDLMATLVRIGLIGLLAALMIAVLPSPVTRVAERVAAEPWRAGFVGLAAQLLFVPLLVVTVVVLAVSIIGIPLLLLVPFGLIAVAVALIMGFAGASCAVGRWIGRRAGSGMPGLLVSLVVGLAVVFALTVVARFAGLAGLPVRVVLGSVLVAGFIVEYVAWTVGLGGVLLSRFGRRAAPPPVPAIPV